MGATPNAWTLRLKMPADGVPPGITDSRREGDTLVVTVKETSGSEAVSRMSAAGAEVLSLEPLRPSLEERLLSLIGGSST